MLPNPEDTPPSPAQAIGLPVVSLLVLLELGQPVSRVRLRECLVLRAAVPEATIDEDSHLRTGEDDVRSHALHTAMETEAKTLGMKRRAKGALRGGVLPLHPAHVL
jgi:hypothetical protein